MTRKQLRKIIKEELKQAAKEIRQLKFDRKNREDGTKVRPLYQTEYKLSTEQHDYRHKHIAYCMFFFNTPYAEIEVYTEKPLYEHTIDSYKKRWEEKIDERTEDVRLSA